MLNSDMDEQEMLELQVEEASESPLRSPLRLLMGTEKGMEEEYMMMRTRNFTNFDRGIS